MRSAAWLGMSCALALTACSSSRSVAPALGMEWAPVDSLEARLPPSIQVWAGVSASDTLRAWAVRLGPEVALEVEVAADSSGREGPSTFAERTGACVVLNGGYFDMSAGGPVGLVLDDGRLVSPAFDRIERDGVAYSVARGAVGIGDRVESARARDDGAVACRARVDNEPGAPADVQACQPWAVREALGAG
ncbi:hypothetical protein, partial [Rubrivirga sp.]|uniref:hypothetical protein n=1 Tax=Rubrivirga sp. TaxID=1885344 RepID=UPI003C795E7F